MNIFPQKVWELSRVGWDGKSYWYSRPATPADDLSRIHYFEDFEQRQRDKEPVIPDRVHRREG